MIPSEVARELDELKRQVRLLGGGTVRQADAGSGGRACKTLLVKTLSEAEPNSIVECAVYSGGLGSETVTGDTVVCYVRGVTIGANIWCWATPLCAIRGAQAGGGTSSVAVDTEHPSGFIGPADHEIVPLQCNPEPEE